MAMMILSLLSNLFLSSKLKLTTSILVIILKYAPLRSPGVHEYLPILFDDMHFCVLHSMFHAVLMGKTPEEKCMNY